MLRICFPFIEAIRNDQAPPFQKRLPEAGLFVQGFHPGIDMPGSIFFFCPGWYQAPGQKAQPFSGFMPDDGRYLLGREHFRPRLPFTGDHISRKKLPDLFQIDVQGKSATHVSGPCFCVNHQKLQNSALVTDCRKQAIFFARFKTHSGDLAMLPDLLNGFVSISDPSPAGFRWNDF
jgi:hypothetical protein